MGFSVNTRLITFGDSWTAGHGIETESHWIEDATPPKFIQKLREQNSWPRWVSDKLHIPFVNMGVCGFGNEFILKEIETSLKENYLNSDDIVIVVFSYPYRYRTKNEYTPHDVLQKIHNLLKNHTHFLFNGFYPLLNDEEFDSETLPTTFISHETSLADILKEYEIQNNKSVWELDKRSVWNDTQNFWEGDYHPNLLGYKIIAEYIYSEIKNKINAQTIITP